MKHIGNSFIHSRINCMHSQTTCTVNAATAQWRCRVDILVVDEMRPFQFCRPVYKTLLHMQSRGRDRADVHSCGMAGHTRRKAKGTGQRIMARRCAREVPLSDHQTRDCSSQTMWNDVAQHSREVLKFFPNPTEVLKVCDRTSRVCRLGGIPQNGGGGIWGLCREQRRNVLLRGIRR